MLDEQLEHIVLVHYRHIKEGYKSGVSHSPAAPVSLVGSSRTSSAPSSVKIESPISVFQTSVSSTANEVEQAGRASVCDDRHSENGPQVLSHARPIDTSIPHNARLLGHEATGFAELMRDPLISWSSSLPSFYPGSGLSSCATIENTSRTTVDMNDGELHVEADPINQHVQNFRDRLMTDVCIQPVTGMLHAVNQVQKEHDLVSLRTQFHHHHPVLATKNVVEQKFQDGGLDNDDPQNVESGELKKLDFSGNYWKSLDANNEDKEVSSLRGMHLDMDSLSPYLSQEQLFSIIDFAPDWAYAGVRTKLAHFWGVKWGCMFGEIEVSAEVLAENAIQCQTPLHSPGRVPFYVTCSNRLACSEIREFEYLENPNKSVSHVGIEIKPEDEIQLEVRLLKILNLGPHSVGWKCSVPKCENSKIKRTMYLTRDKNKNFQIGESNHMSSRDVLFQRLVSDKLFKWLVFKVHEGGKGPNMLDAEGQGVIHLAAGLGYVEETVIALVKLGAIPGLVDDPTSAFPRGETAADLASSRGYKGIAGYLAEADLMTMDEQHYLGESLAAFQKSAYAAASIQAAFRARSFCQRQLAKNSSDISEDALDQVADSLNKSQFLLPLSSVSGGSVCISISPIQFIGCKCLCDGGNIASSFDLLLLYRLIRLALWLEILRKIDEYEFLSIGRRQKSADVNKALDRVKSMVRNPEARHQYMKLVMKSQNFKTGDGGSSQPQPVE
ncbi:hypothetical protein Ahy_A09g043552 isoform B [Arachis hypogaea]|uniref:CG-1 domain-containing protein n=1 Tax=Arachis hypogaea TaxID=3818 RepID=A0A445BIJ7_ARAHY|nr:hypothetical protein Ahy_A09g043552 isoform B [Arachis hypogaea]